MSTENHNTKDNDLVAAQLQQLQADKKRIDDAYAQRNAMVILAARLALALGWKAGWQLDPNKPDWDEEWRVVVYIELPGEGVSKIDQVSFHMSPPMHLEARNTLPPYEGEWDGTFHGRNPQMLLQAFRDQNRGRVLNFRENDLRGALSAILHGMHNVL